MRAKRVDQNQAEIVKLLRDLGCSVFVLSSVGQGCPDLMCGLMGLNFLIEVKDGNKPLSQQRLTVDEQEFFDTWRGNVVILRSVDDAVGWISRVRHKYNNIFHLFDDV